jgi:primosomal protein N' (replication factor Y)
VRVLPDVAAIGREFDYGVPHEWLADERAALVRIGSVVRIDLNGRRVGGWIVDDDVEPTDGVTVRGLAKISGLGPDADVLALARWTAWRWAGRVAAPLTAATPGHVVSGLPARGEPPSASMVPVGAAAVDGYADRAFAAGAAVLRVPASIGDRPLVLAAVRAAAARGGWALVLSPSVDRARVIAADLRRAHLATALYPRDWAQAAAGACVVGARAAAFAPLARLGAVLVLDEHDEAYKEERTPAWHARDVVIERARRAGVPCVLSAPSPTLDASWRDGRQWGETITMSRNEERAAWPIIDVIDVRREEPGGARLSARLVPVLRGPGPVVCVLNRTGRAKLLACGACGEIARCETHRVPLVQDDAGVLTCPHGDEHRPAVCANCGSTALRNLRQGVARVREELEALAMRPVIEVTGAHVLRDARADVYIGTEAVLHQLTHAHAVIFLDFDQELLAPRVRAGEQAMTLLTRAARLVGARADGGRILVQTRWPRHDVLDAAQRADPGRFAERERARRHDLHLPPFRADALVSGSAAAEYVDRLGHPLGITVQGPSNGQWLVHSRDHRVLCDALAAVDRPSGRLRVEVDPLRI